MKKLWFPLMLLFILLNVSACNAEQECPVEVHTGASDSSGLFYNIVITSVADSVTINDVIVNRGNAREFFVKPKPITLKFGDMSRHIFGSAPKEIEVQTDMGNWTFRP